MSETRATEVIFRARGLTKVYRMGDVEVRALRGIDLELFQGEFVVMLGPSGSGKSTLLNILGGLDTPTAGEVWYHGEDLSHADDARLTRCHLPKRWRWSGWRGGWIIFRRSFLAANSSGWRLPAPLPSGRW